jgi:hypothetical protein
MNMETNITAYYLIDDKVFKQILIPLSGCF